MTTCATSTTIDMRNMSRLPNKLACAQKENETRQCVADARSDIQGRFRPHLSQERLVWDSSGNCECRNNFHHDAREDKEKVKLTCRDTEPVDACECKQETIVCRGSHHEDASAAKMALTSEPELENNSVSIVMETHICADFFSQFEIRQRYWQVTGIPRKERPEKTELLHGRFSWRKKTCCKVVIIEVCKGAKKKKRNVDEMSYPASIEGPIDSKALGGDDDNEWNSWSLPADRKSV